MNDIEIKYNIDDIKENLNNYFLQFHVEDDFKQIFFDYIFQTEKNISGLKKQNEILTSELEKLYDYTGKNWSSIIKHNSNINLTINKDGIVLYSNKDFSGFSSKKIIGKSLFKILKNCDGNIKFYIEQCFKNITPQQPLNIIIPSDKNYIFEASFAPILYKDEVIACFVSFLDLTEKNEISTQLEKYHRDFEILVREKTAEYEKTNSILEIELSEKKRTEKVLLDQKFFLQEILDRIPIPVFYINKLGIYLGCNKQFEKFINSKRDKIIGKTIFDFFDKKIATKYHEDDMKVIRESGSSVSRFSMINNGSINKHYILNKTTYKDSTNEVSGMIGVLIDNSDQYHSKNLVNVEKDFNITLSNCYTMQDAFERYIESVMKVDSIDCGIIYFVDSKSENLYMACHEGFSEIFLKNSTIIHSNNPLAHLSKKKTATIFSYSEIVIKRLNNFIDEGVKSFIVIPVVYKNNIFSSIILGSKNINSITNDYVNTFKSMASTLGQIINKIQMDVALRESENRYKKITESITDFIFNVEIKDNVVTNRTLSEACEAITGYTPYDFDTNFNLWEEIIFHEDFEVVKGFFDKLYSGDQNIDTLEYRIVKKDNEIRWVRSTIITNYNIDGNLISYDGLIQDITEYKKAFIGLVESENISNAIINTIDDSLFMVDKKGIIISVNDSFCKKYSITKEKIVKTSIYNYFNSENNKILKDELKKTLRLRKNDWFEFIENGQVIRNHVYPVMDNNGEVNRLVILSGDITREKRLENEIVNVSETERIRIGHDLHDGVGQYFAGIGFIARSLKNLLDDKDNGKNNKIDEIINLVNDAKKQVRIIAKGYAPVDLNQRGLFVALKELCRNTENLLKLKCNFKCNFKMEFEDNTNSTHVYYIIRESVNNAIHHGKAKKITIEIEKLNDEINFKVIDDGIGFDYNEDENSGLGIKLMKYRASIIGASLNIYNNSEHGATVSLKIKY